MVKTRIGKVIFLLVLFFLAVPLLGFSCSKKKSINENQQKANLQAELENPKLEREYEVALKAVMDPYWQTGDYSGLKDKILAQKAPAKYLDLHLNLVIALDSLEQGTKESDQVKIKTAQDNLLKLKNQYRWLE
ncbi:MAG: hypothetical protein WCW26_00630 [Candidatus Buchananbacteria bacterium]